MDFWWILSSGVPLRAGSSKIPRFLAFLGLFFRVLGFGWYVGPYHWGVGPILGIPFRAFFSPINWGPYHWGFGLWHCMKPTPGPTRGSICNTRTNYNFPIISTSTCIFDLGTLVNRSGASWHIVCCNLCCERTHHGPFYEKVDFFGAKTTFLRSSSFCRTSMILSH